MHDKEDPQKVFRRVYISQIAHAAERGQAAPSYTFEDFIYWLDAQPNLITLWDAWQKSGWNTKLKPSVDRLDESKSYTLDNIQLLTWEENYQKAQTDRKTGKRILQHKAVRALRSDGSVYGEYISTREAARAVHGEHSKISKVANKAIQTKPSGNTYVPKFHKELMWEWM